MKTLSKDLYYLIEYLTTNINLSEFLETEAGCKLKWSRPEVSAKCNCPLHDDKNASFFVTLKESGVWISHCFGCNFKGTIIQFCKQYHSLRNTKEAILFLCKKFKIENTEDLIVEGMKNIKVKVDAGRKIENVHILTSNQCRMLLKSDYSKHQKWVLDAYKRLNVAMDKEDYEAVEKIGYEASKLAHGE